MLLLVTITASSQELRIEEKKEFPIRDAYVREAEFSPFRNYFAITIGDNTLEIYDRNWELIFSHQGNPASFGGIISFSPDERFLAYGRFKGGNDIAIISLKDLKVIQILRNHDSWINDLEFSGSGDYLASASNDKSLSIWERDGDSFELTHSLSNYDRSPIAISFSKDDSYLISADESGFASIYRFQNGIYKEFQKIKSDRGYLEGVAFNPVSEEFITASSNGLRRYAFDGKSFTPKDSIMDDLYVRSQIRFSPDGEFLSVPNSMVLKICRVTDSNIEIVDALYRHTDNVFGGSFSDDGQYLATYSSDKKLIVWDISPVRPSIKSTVSSWVNDNLTPAQRKILTYDIVNYLYSRVDQNMISERDEFETSIEYNIRRTALEDWTISLIQGEMEKYYSIKSSGKAGVSIPIQSVMGYNADKQIYKVRFMETEAGVSIPINQAKILKENWKRASIIATKSQIDGKRSSLYSNYRLTLPGESVSYEVIPLNNPFHASIAQNERVAESVPEESISVQNSDLSANNEGVVSHALLFATNIYDSFSELVNPVLDARTIGDELSDNFGVITEVVINSTLTQTVEKIREYASRKYEPNENLIIFFAGHGVYDEVFREGYVISRDSRADDISKTSYLSHSNLRTIVNNINCEHIFLIMDVCFGGTIDPHLATSSHRGAMEMYADIPKEEFIDRKMKYKTRLYLTSGGKEYVPDGRQGYHSPFARRFLESLRKYGGEDGVLTTSEILQYVEKVNPQPRFGEFGDNEPGSDFIMIAR